MMRIGNGIQRVLATLLLAILCHQVALGSDQKEQTRSTEDCMFRIVKPDGTPLAGADVWLGLKDGWTFYDALRIQMDLGTTDSAGRIPWRSHVSDSWMVHKSSFWSARDQKIAISHQDFGIVLTELRMEELIGRTIRVRASRARGTFKNTHHFLGKVKEIEMWPTATKFGPIPKRVQETWHTTIAVKKGQKFLFPMKLSGLSTFNVKFDQCTAQVYAADCVRHFLKFWRPSELWLPKLALFDFPKFDLTTDDYDLAIHTLKGQSWQETQPDTPIEANQVRGWHWLIDLKNKSDKSYAPAMDVRIAVGTKSKNAKELHLSSKKTSNGIQCIFETRGNPKKYPQQQSWTVDMVTGESKPTQHPKFFQNQQERIETITVAMGSPQPSESKRVTWHLQVEGHNRPGLLLVRPNEKNSAPRFVITNADGTIRLPRTKKFGEAWLLEGGKKTSLTPSILKGIYTFILK